MVVEVEVDEELVDVALGLKVSAAVVPGLIPRSCRAIAPRLQHGKLYQHFRFGLVEVGDDFSTSMTLSGVSRMTMAFCAFTC